LIIQLPSNNIDASMPTLSSFHTLSSLHLFLLISYVFNVPREKYHQLSELWPNMCGDTRQYCDILKMKKIKLRGAWLLLQASTNFLKKITLEVHLPLFHHFQCAFITFFDASTFYLKKNLFKVFNSYLMLNLTQGYNSTKFVWK